MPTFPQDVYARHLSSLHGYPLWTPGPTQELLIKRREGLLIGDVGVVIPDIGCFDVYFNICFPRDNAFHGDSGVPDNFEPVKLVDSTDTRTIPDAEAPGSVIPTSLVKSIRTIEQSTDSLTRTHQSGQEYQFNLSSNEGALLILPEGAERCDLRNHRLFLQAAIKHGVDWYRFAEDSVGQIISHDSLYLITGFHKTRSWSLAAFEETEETADRPAQFKASQIGSNDIATYYRWEVTRGIESRVGPIRNPARIPNQSVFIRGFKIALQTRMFGTKWIRVKADAPSTQPNHAEFFSTVPVYSYLWNMLGGLFTGWMTQASGRGTREEVAENSGSDTAGNEVGDNEELSVREHHVVVQHVPEVPQAFHPSDIINRYLLAKEPSATIAITHDDDWITMLEENLLQPEDLAQDGCLETLIAHEYDIISNQGAVYLQRRKFDAEGRIGDTDEFAKRLDVTQTLSEHSTATQSPRASCKGTPCGWRDGNEICGVVIQCGDVPQHLRQFHAIRGISASQVVECGWCFSLHLRKNFPRHVQEYHLGHSRKYGHSP